MTTHHHDTIHLDERSFRVGWVEERTPGRWNCRGEDAEPPEWNREIISIDPEPTPDEREEIEDRLG